MYAFLEILRKYHPLIILLYMSFFGALFLWLGGAGSFMPFFMGLGFFLFAFVKLLHLNDFANGFQKYDLLAKIIPWYGKVYPGIELFLSLLYLSHLVLPLTNIITLSLMILNTAGILKSIARGKEIKCACLGNFIDAPLGTVTLIENSAMGIMALYMLLY